MRGGIKGAFVGIFLGLLFLLYLLSFKTDTTEMVGGGYTESGINILKENISHLFADLFTDEAPLALFIILGIPILFFGLPGFLIGAVVSLVIRKLLPKDKG